jgi:hypothetical protein
LDRLSAELDQLRYEVAQARAVGAPGRDPE